MLSHDLPILVVRAVISSSCWWCELCLRRSSSNSISCCHMTYQYSWWGRWFPLAAGDVSSAWAVHPVTQSHAVSDRAAASADGIWEVRDTWCIRSSGQSMRHVNMHVWDVIIKDRLPGHSMQQVNIHVRDVIINDHTGHQVRICSIYICMHI